MSFINLLENNIWTLTDINNKVQNLIRSKYSNEDEMKAARLSRKQNISNEELNFITELDNWIKYCVEEGNKSKKDSELLQNVLEYEKAKAYLALSAVTPELNQDNEIINQDLVDVYNKDKIKFENIISNASSEVVSLYEIRNPQKGNNINILIQDGIQSSDKLG